MTTSDHTDSSRLEHTAEATRALSATVAHLDLAREDLSVISAQLPRRDQDIATISGLAHQAPNRPEVNLVLVDQAGDLQRWFSALADLARTGGYQLRRAHETTAEAIGALEAMNPTPPALEPTGRYEHQLGVCSNVAAALAMHLGVIEQSWRETASGPATAQAAATTHQAVTTATTHLASAHQLSDALADDLEQLSHAASRLRDQQPTPQHHPGPTVGR